MVLTDKNNSTVRFVLTTPETRMFVLKTLSNKNVVMVTSPVPGIKRQFFNKLVKYIHHSF